MAQENKSSCPADGKWDCRDLSACTSGDPCLGSSPGTHGSAGSCWCGYGGRFDCSTLGDAEPQTCTEGYVKSAGDGCNTCECNSGGLWLCTTEACAEPACPLPEGVQAPPCEENSEQLFARVPGTDACCEHCSSTEGYAYYGTIEECEASKICGPGQTKVADDECNTCTCTAEGEWQCSDEPCNTVACGGTTGVTCPAGQYCSYEPGGCGLGDASAFCEPRPIECTQEDAVVCGCDGQTYVNACVAAMAGTTVMTDGPCEAPPVD